MIWSCPKWLHVLQRDLGAYFLLAAQCAERSGKAKAGCVESTCSARYCLTASLALHIGYTQTNPITWNQILRQCLCNFQLILYYIFVFLYSFSFTFTIPSKKRSQQVNLSLGILYAFWHAMTKRDLWISNRKSWRDFKKFLCKLKIWNADISTAGFYWNVYKNSKWLFDKSYRRFLRYAFLRWKRLRKHIKL